MTGMELIEQDSGWLLPLAGQEVTRCCVDYAAVSLLSSAGIEVYIEGRFIYREPSGREHVLAPVGDSMALAPILRVRFRIFREVIALKDGRLNILFDDGSQLSVPADDHFEPWTIAGPGGVHGLKVVSVPGGDLAIWSDQS
jgi:Family of unknown function (DUF6188)